MSQNQPFDFKENTKYDKDKIKYSLTIEQIASIVDELGGESQIQNNILVAKTICHNSLEEESSHKLYYYENTHLFHCYTDCGDSFDIFELVCRAKNINKQFKIGTDNNGKKIYKKWELFDSILFVLNYFNLTDVHKENKDSLFENGDWQYFNKCEKENNIQESQIIELKYYNEDVLKFLPQPRILPWEKDGISFDIIKSRGIKYDPVNIGIIIPHYSPDNRLLGIRTRTLIKEDEIYGKYRPAYLNGKMYNHPLGFNLFNLNYSRYNIQTFKKAIVFEGEKGCFQYASYFGIDNDISVAVCGSSFTNYQFNLLKKLGVSEIVIAFDRQYKEANYRDEEWKKWTKKLKEINNKYGSMIQISFLFDKENLLDYKDSPTDKGKEVFLKLYSERVII